jgi:uncharacterized protein
LMRRYRFAEMKVSLIWLVCLMILPLSNLTAQYVKYTYPNGIVSSEGTMVSGQPDGYWRTYYSDGTLKTEGNRKFFKLDSVWKFYRKDSTLERMITYLVDVKHGSEMVCFKNGKPQEVWTNENGIKSGKVSYYYDSGELWKVIDFKNNKEEGKGTEYEKDGRIISLYVYKNGFVYSYEKINRYNEQQRKTGIWRDLYESGDLKEEGNYTNGLRNGVFKNYDRKGKLVGIQQYVDDVLMEGENATAIPDIRQDFYEDGQIKSSGSYRNGKKQGTFRQYDPRGNEEMAQLYEQDLLVAEGNLDSLGRKVGLWKLYYLSGQVKAEGSYKEGLKEGNWKYFYSDGVVIQVGSYTNDLPVGNWKWYYSNSLLHRDENYLRGKENGHCVEYDSLGNVLTEGDYANGRRTGPWILKVNDHKEEGLYEDGELTGLWTWSYGDGGKAFEGEYMVGTPVGKHKYWYPSGQIKMKGTYEGGELAGRWDYYDEDGTLSLQLEYEAGVVIKINGNRIKLPEAQEE